MPRRLIVLLGIPLVLGSFSLLHSQSIRIATLNVWTGVDYRGTWTVGEYETDAARETRFQAVAEELRRVDPDVILLQECNPVNQTGSRFASALGYDWIGQRVNAGIKIGPLGFPTNLNEGLVILARKGLRLKFVDAWRLSGNFGAFGDIVSFHFAEHNIALVGSITVRGREILVVNVHLTSAIPDDSVTRSEAEVLLQKSGAPQTLRARVVGEITGHAKERAEQVVRLVELVEAHGRGMPLILGGDFNATDTSAEMKLLTGRFLRAIPPENAVTWDPANPNTEYSRRLPPNSMLMDTLNAWYDGIPRAIDHVFLGGGFQSGNIRSASIFADRPHEGGYVSDHYGLLVEVEDPPDPGTADPVMPLSVEVLPILSYDTDVGFGYGAKGFLLNAFSASESIDLTVFNSSKGERWYRMVFSVPDFELRQGTVYSWSVDAVFDYDRYLVSNFFGVGSESRAGDRETYTKELTEAQLLLGRGWNEEFVTQVGLKFRTVRNTGFPPTGMFATTLPPVNHGRSSGLSLAASLRFDSRDSYINPSRGHVVQLDLERGLGGDYRASSALLTLQGYVTLFHPKTVLAARVMGQAVDGVSLPLHAYPGLGGNRTLRGYPQDRFLGRALMLGNLETRFPIVWRLQGLAFYDVGQARRTAAQLALSRGWRSNTGLGLRFLMDTFVVRFDIGWSDEGSGLYFNFGHLF